MNSSHAVDGAHDELFAEERKQMIMQEVTDRKKVTVTALSKSLGVSGATVRIYLRDLQRTGMLIRTHGGAIAKTKTGFELASTERGPPPGGQATDCAPGIGTD